MLIANLSYKPTEKSLMKISMIAGIVLSTSMVLGTAHAQVGQDLKDAGHNTANASRAAGHDVSHGTKVATHKTVHGTKVAAHKTDYETKKGYHKTVHGTKHVAHKLKGEPDKPVNGPQR
jgi:hypothetical protein